MAVDNGGAILKLREYRGQTPCLRRGWLKRIAAARGLTPSVAKDSIMSEPISLTVAERIAMVTLNRPPVNAFNAEMFKAFHGILDGLA